MTMGSDARNGLWAGPAGRVSILVAAATVTALVPATAAVASGRALTAGDITTVAGGKAPGPAPGTSVAFSPCGVSFAGGFLYAAAGQTVRKISPQGGQLTTPAGTGRFGPLGDGGPATRASLENACGTADAAGNLVIADLNNFRARVAAAVTGTSTGGR